MLCARCRWQFSPKAAGKDDQQAVPFLSNPNRVITFESSWNTTQFSCNKCVVNWETLSQIELHVIYPKTRVNQMLAFDEENAEEFGE